MKQRFSKQNFLFYSLKPLQRKSRCSKHFTKKKADVSNTLQRENDCSRHRLTNKRRKQGKKEEDEEGHLRERKTVSLRTIKIASKNFLQIYMNKDQILTWIAAE